LRLNQPLIAFQSPKHAGRLGKTFSLLHLNNARVRVMALKKAEKSDEVIVRIVEIDGKPIENLRLVFAAPLTAAREVNGQEMPIGKATVKDGTLRTNLTPYQLRTFAVKLGGARHRPGGEAAGVPLVLQVDQATFDIGGRTLATEMLPPTIDYRSIQFKLHGSGAVIPHGQTIPLPSNARRLYVLAAADGDQQAMFRIGDRSAEITVQDWTGFIGQWDNRTFIRKQEPLPPPPDLPPGAPPRMRTLLEFTGLTPGFIKRAPLAWFASHRHAADGTNEPYAYSYLFAYSFEVPAHAKTLTLPDNDKIRILAITASDERSPIRPAQPLYDTLGR
jgi:alpha-mannosidase